MVFIMMLMILFIHMFIMMILKQMLIAYVLIPLRGVYYGQIWLVYSTVYNCNYNLYNTDVITDNINYNYNVI